VGTPRRLDRCSYAIILSSVPPAYSAFPPHFRTFSSSRQRFSTGTGDSTTTMGSQGTLTSSDSTLVLIFQPCHADPALVCVLRVPVQPTGAWHTFAYMYRTPGGLVATTRHFWIVMIRLSFHNTLTAYGVCARDDAPGASHSAVMNPLPILPHPTLVLCAHDDDLIV
jgi:hypothetical protein